MDLFLNTINIFISAVATTELQPGAAPDLRSDSDPESDSISDPDSNSDPDPQIRIQILRFRSTNIYIYISPCRPYRGFGFGVLQVREVLGSKFEVRSLPGPEVMFLRERLRFSRTTFKKISRESRPHRAWGSKF